MASSMLETLKYNQTLAKDLQSDDEYLIQLLRQNLPVAPAILVADIADPEALDIALVAMAVPSDAAEVAVLPPAAAAPLAPAEAVLAPVAAAEAGQLAADGSVTLTLYTCQRLIMRRPTLPRGQPGADKECSRIT